MIVLHLVMMYACMTMLCNVDMWLKKNNNSSRLYNGYSPNYCTEKIPLCL